jgi:flagellar basal-body rod protein FlgF
MDNTTTIVLSRLMAQQRALDVTATNIANASTPAFVPGAWCSATGW